MKNIHICSFRVKLILAYQEVLKRVGPLVNPNRLLFIQIQTLHPGLHHHRWKERNDCMQNNCWKIIKTNSGQRVMTNLTFRV